MGKIISGVEYNYEIIYDDNDEEKVISRATTSNEADRKLNLAKEFLPPYKAETARIKPL